MIALDTSAIIDLFKGNEDIKKKLLNISEPIVATRLSYLELMFGINPEKKSHSLEEKYYDDFFSDITVYELTKNASKKASEIFFYLKKKGKVIEKFDCIIAAILISNGVKKIITKNYKHFKLIPDIEVISY